MRTIWKYQLNPGRVTELQIPRNSSVISAKAQRDELFIWIEVETTEKVILTTRFHIYGTGHEIPLTINLHFIDTVQLNSIMGQLVWHIFEELD